MAQKTEPNLFVPTMLLTLALTLALATTAAAWQEVAQNNGGFVLLMFMPVAILLVLSLYLAIIIADIYLFGGKK